MPDLNKILIPQEGVDEGADNLFEGATDLNENVDLLTPEEVPAGSVLTMSRIKVRMAGRVLGGLTTFTADPDPLPGARLELRLKGGSVRWPDQVERVNGIYIPEEWNDVVVTHVGTSSSGGSRLQVSIRQSPYEALTGLVFRQDARTAPGLVNNYTDAFGAAKDSSNPSGESLFSLMDELEKYRQRDGFLYFRLRYFKDGAQSGTDIRWRQLTNPADPDAAYAACEGYLAIQGTGQLSIPGQAFGGLAIHANSPFVVWTCFPGATAPESETVGTLGSTVYINESGVTNVTPGITPIGSGLDNAAELYCTEPN